MSHESVKRLKDMEQITNLFLKDPETGVNLMILSTLHTDESGYTSFIVGNLDHEIHYKASFKIEEI